MREELSNADREKTHAALNSLVCAIALAALKLCAGIATNSLGILSEALHSGLDFLAALITLFAVRLASRPADKSYPYGYGKIENLSALAETLLLLVTCGWIVHEAFERLFFKAPSVTLSFWGGAVMLVSILVDVSRARMLHRVARKHKSQALEADALHFSTDIWSSAVVLVGLACVWISAHVPEGTLLWRILQMGDALAALFVSTIVVLVGVRLSRKAVSALLDGGGRGHAERLERRLAEKIPGCAIRRLRVRESGANTFVDLTVEAPSTMPVNTAHALACQVEEVVRGVVPGADVTVHVEPAATQDLSILSTVQALAAVHALSIHNVTLSRNRNDGTLLVFLHVETPPQMTLYEAHRRVDIFERELEIRLEARVVTHIEPEEQNDTVCTEPDREEWGRLHQVVEKAIMSFPQVLGVHDMCVFHLGGAPILSFHCEIPGSLCVFEAHNLASRLERRILDELPELGRILIHTDPANARPDPHARCENVLPSIHSATAVQEKL